MSVPGALVGGYQPGRRGSVYMFRTEVGTALGQRTRGCRGLPGWRQAGTWDSLK